MKGLKVAVIGAGSTYTPELIQGFIDKRKTLEVDSLYLMDIDQQKLNVVGGLVKRILKKNGMTLNVVLTENLEEAIDAVDYVLTQIRIGRLDARILDEKIPMKYDLLGQETTGAGGFMNALRTIPVIMHIAELMKNLAPDAWLINFANPAGIITEAVLNNTDVKMIGLCNVPTSLIKDVKGLLPDGITDFDYEYVGLNHLSWITSIYSEGKNILPDILKNEVKVTAMKNIYSMNFGEDLLKAAGGIPSTYLNYYYFRDMQIKHCRDSGKTRGEICKDIEKQLLDMYKNEELNEKPALLEERGGAYYSTAAISLIDAIQNDKNEIQIVNVKNNGALNFMADDDIVEIKCIVNKYGATPIKIKCFDNNHIIGLMQSVKAYERLTVKAGLYGDYDAALSALIVHPLIGDYNKAKMLLDEMLKVNAQYLPQFSSFKEAMND